jgi:hypothetical protein
VFLLLGALFLTGCGGGSEPPQATGASASDEDAVALDDVETCALLTREQVAAAVGAEVGAGSEWGLSGCEWRADPGPIVVLQVFAGSMLADSTCESQRTLMTGREEDVPGLGESARWSSSGNLVVCSSDAVVRVDMDDSPNAPSDDREALIQIARQAIERLGI